MSDKFEYTSSAIILWSLAKLINEETYNCRFENWNYREPAGGYLISEPAGMHPMNGQPNIPLVGIHEPPRGTINIDNLFRRLISEIKNTAYLIKCNEMNKRGLFSIDTIKEDLMKVFGIDIDNLTAGWDEEFEAKQKEYFDFEKRINEIIEASDHEEESK